MRPGLAVAFALAIVTAACSGGDGDDADTSTTEATVAPSSTAVPVTSASPTGTTSPATTDLPDPTTTVDPTESLIAEIEADLNEGEQALLEAIAAPDDPASEELIRQYFAGDSLELVLAGLADLRSEGLVGRANSEVANEIVVRSLEGGSTASRQVAEVCRVDATVIVDPSSGREIVVNDRITTVVSRSVVVLQDGIWVFETGERLEDLQGATSCV